MVWTGDARSLMRANLQLRTATRVLVRVAKFHARTFAELERHASRVDWAGFLAPGVGAEFRITSRKSRLLHTGAIAERLHGSVGRRTSTSEVGGEGQLFVVRVLRDEFEISADSSGELLHMRGYRQAVAKAPLRETLAAALLLAADWDPAKPLVDPFCGSGTIAIEGALLARRIAPGIHRPFAFMQWPGHVDAAWRAIVDDARAAELPWAPAPILAADRDAGAIRMARANAVRAGTADDIAFSTAAISSLRAPRVRGLVATNPPYGVRTHGASDPRNLFAQIGNVLRRECAGWRVALLSPHSRLISQMALPFTETLRTTNGGIRVTMIVADVP